MNGFEERERERLKPAAPNKWPVEPFVELTITLFPKIEFIALDSEISPNGVEVACALIYRTSEALIPEKSKAFFMHLKKLRSFFLLNLESE